MKTWLVRVGEASPADHGQIGGKARGIHAMARLGIPVPNGFTLTTAAFAAFMTRNDIWPLVHKLERALDEGSEQSDELRAHLQHAIAEGTLPPPLREALEAGLETVDPQARLAVRSSCNYEDLETLSFSGIYHSVLNVDREGLADALRRCYASCYSEQAVHYLREHGIDLAAVQMAGLIQELVPAVAAGTLFTADVGSGFVDTILIEGVWGLGEGLVSGDLTPDAYTVYKRTLAVIGRELGNAEHKVVGAEEGGLVRVALDEQEQRQRCLTDQEAGELARWALIGERHSGHPLDFEWAKSRSGELLMLQMRPLVVEPEPGFVRHEIVGARPEQPLLRGKPITSKAVTGRVKLAHDKHEVFGREDILTVENLDVDWLPRIKGVRGVIIEGGGYTSHAAVILREHGIPAVFGAHGACSRLRDGQVVTLVCSGSEGMVWDGELEIECTKIELEDVPRTQTPIHLVMSTVDDIDRYLRLPVEGVGLVRLEFLIADKIGIHPLALLDYERGRPMPAPLRAEIERRARGYASAREFYIEKLTESLCAFACRCPGRVLNVRCPDFQTQDYLSLLGGQAYELAHEANPMLGWRGTSRLIDDDYVEAFELDCEAFRRTVERVGRESLSILVPFCRTPRDGETIRRIIETHGPAHSRIGMMVELPSNVALGRRFAEIFDFFLIGPMDMTQLVYGADRTSYKMSRYNDETEAVKEMVKFFLSNIQGCAREVFIGGWPLFQYLAEYRPLLSNNQLKLVELPDRILALFDNVSALEERLA